MKVNVIYTDRDGNKDPKPKQMELEHYLRAKKVQPDRFEPADENSRKIAAQIPLEVVPIGTTQQDVDEFERTRGSKKGGKITRFEQMLAAINSGREFNDVPDEEAEKFDHQIKSVQSEQAPDGFKSNAVDTEAGDMNDDDDNQVPDDLKINADPDPDATIENFNKQQSDLDKDENKKPFGYTVEALKQMDLPKIQAIVQSSKLPKGIAAQFLKMKSKDKLAQEFFKYMTEKK